jgi:hypothetical protein
LRKYLIVAVAALTTVAFTAVAVAQEPATLDVKVTPTKAGTKAKKKNSKIMLDIENADNTRTMSKLTITQAPTVKLSGRGLTKCAENVLEAQGPQGCPRASRVGTGTARALVGVNTPSPSPLTFDVTAVVTGNNSIGFFLAAQELPVNVLAPGRISGNKLTIDVPQNAQQPAPGTWAGLVSLNATLGAKKGRNYLVSTSGCKSRKHSYRAQLTFVNNGVSEAGTVNASDTVACRK